MKKRRDKRKKDTWECPKCGAEVSPTDEFCLECGKLLLVSEAYDAYADMSNEE